MAYGSLVIYQEEVVEELSQWANNHSLNELNHFIQELIADMDDEVVQNRYIDTWEEIKVEL